MLQRVTQPFATVLENTQASPPISLVCGLRIGAIVVPVYICDVYVNYI